MMRFRAFVAALALVAVTLTGCENDDLPAAGQYSMLTGTILDRATNKPLSGAIVTVDTVLTATTDENGKFKVDKVPSGIVDYSVQAEGYADVTSTITAEPGKTFELDVSLDQAPAQ